jgi:hypothetical protein
MLPTNEYKSVTSLASAAQMLTQLSPAMIMHPMQQQVSTAACHPLKPADNLSLSPQSSASAAELLHQTIIQKFHTGNQSIVSNARKDCRFRNKWSNCFSNQ